MQNVILELGLSLWHSQWLTKATNKVQCRSCIYLTFCLPAIQNVILDDHLVLEIHERGIGQLQHHSHLPFFPPKYGEIFIRLEAWASKVTTCLMLLANSTCKIQIFLSFFIYWSWLYKPAATVEFGAIHVLAFQFHNYSFCIIQK